MRFKSIVSVILPVLICAGCQAQTGAPTKTAGLNCPDIEGVDKILSPNSPDIIVIGETHGMTAPPAFVSALTCHSLRSGLSTTLALEVTDDEQHLSKYLRSDGDEDAREGLFRDAMWTTGFTDGRSSEAMLSLIEEARVRMSEGSDLSVYPFGGGDFDFSALTTQNEIAAAWEKHLADNLLDAATQSEKVIVLVGSLHAKRGRITFGELNYETMSEHLPADRSMTFEVVTTGGTAWNCVGQPIDCAERRASGMIGVDHPFAEGGLKILPYKDMSDDLRKTLNLGPGTYDGVVFAGQAKASPPANTGNRLPLKTQ